MNAPKPKLKSAFADMETAPQDGTHLTLTDGKTEAAAMWQKSRRFEGGKWQPKGKWVDPYTRSNILLSRPDGNQRRRLTKYCARRFPMA